MRRMSSIARFLIISLVMAAPAPGWSALAQPATPVAVATPLAPGATEYIDPAGRFILPIPTGWTAATVGEAGVLTSPDGGITVYALALSGTEIPDALDRAWHIVDPTFDLTTDETVDVPATAGLPSFTVTTYEGGPSDETVQAVAQVVDGVTYAVLVRADLDEAARRASQLQTAALGLQVTGAEATSLQGVTPRALTPAMLAEVDAFVDETMERFGIPGAAYAVVQDRQIVHAAGFGVRAVGTQDRVTAETLMMVGSVTKPMTTTYMAAIVDDGKMRWDEPVVDILPSFAVADPEVTPLLTVRNLVCACTGVPRRDLELIFQSQGVTAEQAIASLRAFTFFTPVGEAFQYSNQMVAAGGFIAAIADGGSLDTVYDDYVAGMNERVFTPMGMTSTTFSFEEVQDNGNFARPHALSLDGTVTEFPLEAEIQVAPVAPAGGAWSNVEDLSRFAITQMNRGVAPDGRTVVSEENLTETWRPQVLIGPGFSYGLGWVISDYKDQPLLVHDGGTLGFSAEVAFLPEAGIGVTIVANQAGAMAFSEAVRDRVFEMAFDQPAEGGAGIEFAVEQQRQAFAELAETLVPLDESGVMPFLGTWEHPALGEVTLKLVDGRLILDAGEFVSEIVVARDDESGETFYLTATPPLGGLRISLRDEAGMRSLVVHDPASTDLYVFAPKFEPGAKPVATPIGS